MTDYIETIAKLRDDIEDLMLEKFAEYFDVVKLFDDVVRLAYDEVITYNSRRQLFEINYEKMLSWWRTRTNFEAALALIKGRRLMRPDVSSGKLDAAFNDIINAARPLCFFMHIISWPSYEETLDVMRSNCHFWNPESDHCAPYFLDFETLDDFAGDSQHDILLTQFFGSRDGDNWEPSFRLVGGCSYRKQLLVYRYTEYMQYLYAANGDRGIRRYIFANALADLQVHADEELEMLQQQQQQ